MPVIVGDMEEIVWRRFVRFVHAGLVRRGVDPEEIGAWTILAWYDLRDYEAAVRLVSPTMPAPLWPGGGRPSGEIAVTGTAPLRARARGWHGWHLYRAAARALRALG